MAIFFIIIPQITSLPIGVPSTLYSRLIISLRKEENTDFQLIECRMRRYRALSGNALLVKRRWGQHFTITVVPLFAEIPCASICSIIRAARL